MERYEPAGLSFEAEDHDAEITRAPLAEAEDRMDEVAPELARMKPFP